MLETIDRIVHKAIEEQYFPGCVIGVISGTGTWCQSWGRLTYDDNSPAVTNDTVYDVASITKAIPVSCCALHLVEQGMMKLDDTLCSILPEYSGGYREEITVRHLLTQTLDYDFRLSSYKDESAEEIRTKILDAPLATPPGRKYSYANATSILLGWVIERKTGLSLDNYAEKLFFQPLGMNHTTFFPEILPKEKIAPTEYDPWRDRLIYGEVHDESAAAMLPEIGGAAGLFSTAPDLLTFAAMLLGRGTCGNKRFFKPDTITLMHTRADFLIDPEQSVGYGWELHQKHFMGTSCTEATFGKTGFTGCSIVLEPVRKIAVILLSNHVHPKRYKDRSRINTVRAGIAEAVFRSVDMLHKKR
jgi:CubicO group peptidase (beta-lactamase class C family)